MMAGAPPRSDPGGPTRPALLAGTPVMAVLLGVCVIAVMCLFTMLNWQRRIALETERGAATAALAEARVNEAIGSVTTSLYMMANRRAWNGDWVEGLTRAATVGGRIGSVSLLSATGRIDASTAPRNVGKQLSPDEFGGGWATARFGVGTLFQGRDLFDRRPVPPHAAADFVVISVPSPDGDFVVATLSLRSLHVSLASFLSDQEALGVGLYWPNGERISSVGPVAMPPTLTADAVRAVAASDRYQKPPPFIALTDTAYMTCRSSRADPFVVCTRQTLDSFPREWQDWRGVAFGLLLLADIVLVAGAIRIAAERRHRRAEREAVRQSISRSDRRQRVALDAATGLVWECDAALTSIRYYGNVHRLLGPDAPAAEPLADFLNRLRPDDAANLAGALRMWPASDRTDLAALVQLAPPGSAWLRISGRREADAELTLVGSMEDVTPLLETSERYRAVFRKLAQPILLLNDTGLVEEVNPAAEATFGGGAAALQGRDIGALIRPADASPARDNLLADIVSGGTNQLTGVRADGTTFPVAVATGTWVVEGQNRIVAILRDLSAEKEIEQRQTEARLAADRASQAKSEFLSTMSHEIRTPLNGVIGTADLLAGTSLDPEQARYVTVLQDSADHLLRLINDILDLSKMESADIDLDETPFDTAALVKGTVALLEARAVAKGLTITGRIDPAVPGHLIGDVGRIRQILLNLVGNALKFTEAGSVTLAVSGVNPVCFAIHDTGIGIRADQIDRLFANFVQLDGSIGRRFGGTGLGLAISNRLAARMGGRIEVTSTPNVGSVFRLMLPLASAVPAAPTKPPAALTHPATAEPAGLRILVAEDGRTNQLVIRRTLELLGHTVQVVDDGRQAVDAAMAGDFDVVLMDMMMPVMDGLEATRTLRAMDRFASLPIVAVTAGAFTHDYDACMAAGMTGFVTKPVNRQGLRSALADAMAWRASQPEAVA